MVRVLIGVAAAAFLLLAYAAYPYVTIWQLNQAVNEKDASALEALVDWDSVGEGLSADLVGLFGQPDPESADPMDELEENLIGIFADFMIDPLVAFYTTPDGFAHLLSTQAILEDPGAVPEEEPGGDTWYDHISFAFFTGPATFHVAVRSPEESNDGASEAASMVLEFRLQSFRWQLTRVNLPLDDLAA